MNLKRIIIAITVVLIGTGNINAQDMKTEVPKISDFPVGPTLRLSPVAAITGTATQADNY